MTNILFVCHGNICRSPMAEFVMKDLVAKRGLAQDFHIASAATSTEEIWNGCGNPVYPPVQELLHRHGMSCSGKRAVQVTKADGAKYDYIVVMDQKNLCNIKKILSPTDMKKVKLLLEYIGEDRDVADPWYTRNFEATWDDVNRGCTALLDHIVSECVESDGLS